MKLINKKNEMERNETRHQIIVYFSKMCFNSSFVCMQSCVCFEFDNGMVFFSSLSLSLSFLYFSLLFWMAINTLLRKKKEKDGPPGLTHAYSNSNYQKKKKMRAVHGWCMLVFKKSPIDGANFLFVDFVVFFQFKKLFVFFINVATIFLNFWISFTID